MRLFRFCRQPLRGLVILIEQFPAFLRLSWVCMAASLLGGAVSERYIWLGSITDLLARGVFAVAWLRLVGLGEMPGRAAYFRLGRREIFTALGWMSAEIFVIFPAQVIAASLAIATGQPFADLVMPLLAIAHALLGAAYLLPTEAALEVGSNARWRLPEMVMKGGVAAGLAVFLAWLPTNLLLEGVKALPVVDLLEGLTLGQMAAVPVRYLGVALTAGAMALVWNALTAEAE
ncbi:MAG: hypothetical protein EPN20_01755 [Magnetospirillum sp.]|nr:MAG: hypothetical protein EPN20_01755 [Magnetospirillum sp.]